MSTRPTGGAPLQYLSCRLRAVHRSRYSFLVFVFVVTALRISCLAILLPVVLCLPSDRGGELTPDFAPADVVNSIGMRFVEIPSGSFLMGAPDADWDAEDDEKPQHSVTLTRPFLLGQFEVTQQQYATVVEHNPSYFSKTGRGSDRVRGTNTQQFPAEMISWTEAQRFCELLSKLPAERAAGRSYRLPTEAEWEFACRAGTTTRFWFGDQPSPEYANYKGYVGRPTRIGSYPPNPFGVYDMHGNVLEWCSDWHTDDFYSWSPTIDPVGPTISNDDTRVLRGGAWFFKPATAAFRDAISPHLRSPTHGLRVVMEHAKHPES